MTVTMTMNFLKWNVHFKGYAWSNIPRDCSFTDENLSKNKNSLL